MSVPPITVQVKRKRTDEPVEFLRVQESNGKRQRTETANEFVFSRQPSEYDPSLQTTPQAIRVIKQLPSLGRSSLDAAIHSRGGNIPSAEIPAANMDSILKACSTGAGERISAILPSHETSTPMRRFHISRNATTVHVENPSFRVRHQQQPIIFSERRDVKRQKPPPTPSVPAPHSSGNMIISEATEPDRPRKKPGQAARTLVTSTAKLVLPIQAPARNVRLPSGAVMPWDIHSEQLAAEMQAYTLQEIGRTIAQSEANKPKSRSIVPPSKFKPKKPALRYHERHPEHALHLNVGMDADDPEIYDVEMDDDADYVIDTYIRMPVHQLESKTENDFGLLILDSQPDIDEFYKAQNEEDEEEEDFDEDENAENHYSADYPDEEVDSDDEFDRNAHNYYRKDLDDDDDEGAFSDEGDDQRYPWAKSTWTKKNSGSDDDDDDDDDDDKEGSARDEDGKVYHDLTHDTLAQLAKHRG